MSRHLFLAALIFAAITASLAEGWWCTGHMVVSDIARQIIEDKSPEVNRKIEAVLKEFVQYGPWPANADQTQISCWADDIKGNLGAMNNWHYRTQAYNPDNDTLPDASLLAGTTNVVTQMDFMYKSLRNNPNAWEAGFGVAWLTHLMGDIHQPLHTTTLYDANFPYPKGDVGGNFFSIEVNGVPNKLHKYWDSACETLSFDFDRPLNAEEVKNISDIAEGFINKWGPNLTSHEVKTYSPNTIADASHKLAIEYAYADGELKPKDALTEEYQANCRRVAHRQITLGGYRLANQLIYLLAKSNVSGLENVDNLTAPPSPASDGWKTTAVIMMVLLCIVAVAALAYAVWYFVLNGSRRGRHALGEAEKQAVYGEH